MKILTINQAKKILDIIEALDSESRCSTRTPATQEVIDMLLSLTTQKENDWKEYSLENIEKEPPPVGGEIMVLLFGHIKGTTLYTERRRFIPYNQYIKDCKQYEEYKANNKDARRVVYKRLQDVEELHNKENAEETARLKELEERVSKVIQLNKKYHIVIENYGHGKFEVIGNVVDIDITDEVMYIEDELGLGYGGYVSLSILDYDNIVIEELPHDYKTVNIRTKYNDIINGDISAEELKSIQTAWENKHPQQLTNHYTHSCNESPDGCCHYDAEDGIVTLAKGEIYTLSRQESDDNCIDESGNYHDDDCCLFCGLPFERK